MIIHAWLTLTKLNIIACLFEQRLHTSLIRKLALLSSTTQPAKAASKDIQSKMNVFVTRNVPSSGLELLKSAGFNVSQWNSDEVIPRDKLLSEVKSVDGLFCLLTDKVDSELLDTAGKLVFKKEVALANRNSVFSCLFYKQL